MNTTPKCRWYQFSLKTLLGVITLVGTGIAWWNHSCLCYERADVLESRARQTDVALRMVLFMAANSEESSEKSQLINMAQKAADSVRQDMATAMEYRRAAFLPWLRFGIKERTAK